MIASSVLRASVGGVSHIAPGVAAWAMDAIYSRPAITRHYDRREREMLLAADQILARGEIIDTDAAGGAMRSYLFRTQTDRRGLVLLLHGWTGDARAMTAFIEPLMAAGYDALAVDLPAHGASSGSVVDPVSAAAAVSRLLSERDLRPGHVVAHSFGSGVAAPSQMRAVIDDLCGYFRASRRSRERLRARIGRAFGRDLDDYDAIRLWRGSDAAYLALHSPDDDSVPFSHAERMPALPNAVVTPITGAKHRDIVWHDGCVAAAVAHIRAVDQSAAAAQPREV